MEFVGSWAFCIVRPLSLLDVYVGFHNYHCMLNTYEQKYNQTWSVTSLWLKKKVKHTNKCFISYSHKRVSWIFVIITSVSPVGWGLKTNFSFGVFLLSLPWKRDLLNSCGTISRINLYLFMPFAMGLACFHSHFDAGRAKIKVLSPL